MSNSTQKTWIQVSTDCSSGATVQLTPSKGLAILSTVPAADKQPEAVLLQISQNSANGTITAARSGQSTRTLLIIK
jgi:hypothetical protein